MHKLELSDVDWMAMICQEWAEDLFDPREDIYTLEDGRLVVASTY